MARAEHFDREVAEIRASAFAAGGLPALERVEVALAVAISHIEKVRRGELASEGVAEAGIRTAMAQARQLIAELPPHAEPGEPIAPPRRCRP